MDKRELIQQIIARLQAELSAGTESARAVTAAATDPDSKAENKYDTRNLEASYLARGQAFRVAETMEALAAYELLTVREFAAGQWIGEGALVSLRGADGEFHCFLGPAGGGMELVIGGTEVTVVTPSSPLGSRLRGRKAGDAFEMQPGRPASRVTVLSVV